MVSGIINVLKPAGLTSNGVISEIKKKLFPNKIGHLGTLDPSGTGVLPICINKATRLFDYYLKKDKIYRAVFVFGEETDTLDSDGKITNQNNKEISLSQIESVLPKFVGKFEQMPPKFSAKKIDGKRAYQLARNGEDFEVKPKQIEICDIKVLFQLSKNTFLFEIHCSSGTYVRSIARDLAKELGTFAYMGAIIRTKSGNFEINDAASLNEISEKSIIPLKNILKDWKNVFVKDEFYDKILNGGSVKVDFQNLTKCIVYCKNQLVGIGSIDGFMLKIHTFLWEKND